MQSIKQKCGLDTPSSERKSILGISGSPRRGGNSDTLIDTVLAGAAECGATYDKVILQDLEISPCKACDSCQKTGGCIQDDDMESLFELMEKSDVWVLGTPIYWWGPSAQFKAFIDRWYGVNQRLFQGKQVILVVSMGGNNDYYARHTVGMFKDICHYLGMTCIDVIVASGLNGRNDVQDHPEHLTIARELGIKSIRNCD
ncbi:MAG: flavodoxin family protein [Candidatus Thorarchaeota archaeon]|nr:flavodoxin family protein [Candidatus Thorarchaeota archaeon]